MGANGPLPIAIEERFWDKVEKTETCWLWTGATTGGGYGYIGIRGSRIARAHRVSWEMANGPIPDGLWVLHRCDVRACVRPDHLFLGTHSENMADAKTKDRMAHGPAWRAVRKERAPHGDGHWNAKLSTEDVDAIRLRIADGARTGELAKEYGVSPATISMIRTGKRRARG